MRTVTIAPDFAAWRATARALLQADVRPGEILWQEKHSTEPGLDLFSEADALPTSSASLRVPRRFADLAALIACHRDPARWSRLYRVLWRLTHGEPHLLAITVDPDMHALLTMEKSLRRDLHKMRAFVRFRRVPRPGGGEAYVAWFEPEHHIVERNAPFFRDRFAALHWSILTPDRCAHWDGETLQFTPGVTQADAPTEDAVESLWRRYYASIFNPARVKTHVMQAEMPKKYWKNLPEAAAIPGLLAAAPARVEAMVARSHSEAAVPELGPPVSAQITAAPGGAPTIDALRRLAAHCRACPLHARATQTVFGEGPVGAPLVCLGEQPGEQEDREGRPFIGPAGQLFDRALADAGIDRSLAYVTNSVKHFKWEPRGKRRLHRKAAPREITACRPWLEAELEILRPRVLICLGSTAAQTIFGPGVRVLRDRGVPRASDFCAQTLVTVHPSSLLRAPDEAAREAGYRAFVADLRRIGELLR